MTDVTMSDCTMSDSDSTLPDTTVPVCKMTDFTTPGRLGQFPCGGYMSLEQWIYRNDVFRYSTHDNPLPLPVVEKLIEPLTGESPDPEIKRQTHAGIELKKIFTKCGIKRSAASYTVKIRSIDKPGYDAAMDENPLFPTQMDSTTSTKVFLVEINASRVHPSLWKNAGDSFQRYLVEQGMEEYYVEMRDLNRAFQPSLFPLRSTHPDVIEWEAIRDQLTIHLDKKLPSQWRNLSLWNVKSSVYAESVVMVVIHVDVRLERDWSRLSRNLYGYLPIDKRWNILWLPGGVSRSTRSRTSTELVKGRNVKNQTSTGCSIGRGGGEVATLGGYVRLEQGPRIHHCVMTTHSAARLHYYEAQEAVRRLTDRYGCAYFNMTPQVPLFNRPTFQFPARADCEPTKQDCHDTLTLAQEKFYELQRKISLSPGTLATPSATEKLTRLQQQVMTAQQHVQEIANMPWDMGSVIVSSGRHIGPRFSADRKFKPVDGVHWELTSKEPAYLDWALVEVRANSWPYWAAKTRAPLVECLGNQLPRSYGLTKTYNNYHVTQRADQFTAIEKNNWYAKRGRTTDATAGVCHGTALYTNRHATTSEPMPMYDEEDREITKNRTKHYKELVILNSPILPLEVQRSFCASGDEGAFIFDAEGQAAGMLVGMLTSRCGPPPKAQTADGSEGAIDERELYVSAGIVTSMHHILPSVKAHTVDKRTENEILPGGQLFLA